ncbi:MAG: aminoacyl-tRNA hydrolase [Planctomycetes bacterium]|nr:aminoacyl-tRNA hydrolase [Planctomycetota bacterium]
MRLVLAIGNPGVRYAETRHNIGFAIADEVARRRRVFFRKAQASYLEAAPTDEGRLIKPLTFVNRSGEALMSWLEGHESKLEGLLVLVDDVSLAVGRLRVRQRGSNGGHNGLKDLERVLQGGDFARLRFGVGASLGRGENLVDHVLGEFSPEERVSVTSGVSRAADAVVEYLEGQSLEVLMRRYNGSAPPVGG